ncbi:unnamed protein product [Microthlaspi erraticum]|uniref:Uncharacterized protein n=1 Tax=Microthlaspi erraticum TaxID=1685480 RepID=A0A6D2HLN9_9BRAS|nr:unnamed protein product [Microthlaspi erraticum]
MPLRPHQELSLRVLKVPPRLLIPRWFTLCRKPNQTLTPNDDDDTIKSKKRKKKPIGIALAKIQAPHLGTHQSSRSLVTIGSNIYNIGGPIDDDHRSSNVSSSTAGPTRGARVQTSW